MKYLEEVVMQDGLNEEQCWSAMQARDTSADGTFVVAVRSTGIYCRPSCPARHAKREHIVFFRLPEEAVAAGFRACKRCHPDLAQLPDPGVELVEQICQYIGQHLDGPLRLSDLSLQFHLSPYYLQRTFKRIKGISPRQYAEACRLEQLKVRLKDGEAVTSALYNAGYQSSSSVYERTPGQLGMTPGAYRQGGKDIKIQYALIESDLGYVLVAATTRGIVAIRFDDSEQALEADLKREYPEAELARNEEELRPWTIILLQALQGEGALQSVPLDLQGTAFQWKVWQALRAIPVGQTRSYSQIAEAIGQPTASRAVARACATNPVAVLIPCHRVVRNNGQLGGYHYGTERKQQLLAREHAILPSVE